MVQYGTLSVQISVTATDWKQLVSYVFVSVTYLHVLKTKLVSSSYFAFVFVQFV